MHCKRLSWVALVGIGLAGVVAASAAASTLAARSTASPLEIVLHGRHEPCPDGAALCTARHVGTFTSGAPFCESGTAEDSGWASGRPNSGTSVLRVYECADGSGSLGLWITSMRDEHQGAGSEWRIDPGTGRYGGLRGRGISSEELLGGNPEDPVTITSKGFVGADDIAPSLAFTSASATKVSRPAGAYLIRVVFSLRDDVEGPLVAYELGVTEGGRRVLELASMTGTTASGSVSTTVRVKPSSKRVRSVYLRVLGTDWIGNEVSIDRYLKLPR